LFVKEVIILSEDTESNQGQSQGQSQNAGKQEPQKKSTVFLAILLIALVLVGFYTYYWAISPSGQRTLENVKQFFLKYNPVTWYMNMLKQAEDVGQNTWSSKTNATSEVKGLLFKSFKPTSTAEFPQGSPVSLEYGLELKNLEVETLPITVQCAIKGKKFHSQEGKDTGIKVLPSSTITVSGHRIYDDVRCVISSDVTKQLDGTVSVVGSVSFPFKTKGVSLPVYFTTKKVDLGLDGKDFFSYFSIDESQPIRAVYNGEPIEIGIGVSSENKQPVVIGEGRHLLVGLTLRNKWDGFMPKLTELKLEVPKQININKELSQNPNQLCPFVLSRTGDINNEYTIAEEIKKDLKLSSGRLRTFECWFDVKDDLIASDALYSKKLYKANAEYMYHLSNRTAAITIKKIKTEDSKAILSDVIGGAS
jgi:hypothetical protein